MKRLVIILGLASIISIGCNKSKIAQLNPLKNETQQTKKKLRVVSPGITIRNGILNFSTLDAFENKIEELHAMNTIQLEQYNSSFIDFTSLYQKYQILDTKADLEDGISADSAITSNKLVFIPDDIFASVVNDQGLLIVGDSVYYYSDSVFQTLDTARYFNTPIIDWGNIAKKSTGTFNYGNDEWAAFSPHSRFFYVYDGINVWPTHNNRTVRAVHTKWCSWFGVYASVGAKIKLEKHSKLAGWINIDHSSASHSSSSDLRYFGSFTGGGNTWWAWYYYSESENKYTSSKKVNELVLDYKISLIAGPLQHKVNNFVSTVAITRNGCTLNSTWVH